jgi:hypothetical protein
MTCCQFDRIAYAIGALRPSQGDERRAGIAEDEAAEHRHQIRLAIASRRDEGQIHLHDRLISQMIEK